MKFYLLDDPAKPGEFAQFTHVGTWSKGVLCESCGVTTEKLVEPLQIEWDKGSEHIGSFAWCGYHCVVTNEVRSFCERENIECTFGRVEILPPKGTSRIARVSYPYHGPPLNWLIPVQRLSLNESLSGINIIGECSMCGFRKYNFRRDGLIIDRHSWGGTLMFMIEQFGRSGATFVTETVVNGLRRNGFTNFYPRMAGSIQ